MKITPLSSLPLRVRLRAAKWSNRLLKSAWGQALLRRRHRGGPIRPDRSDSADVYLAAAPHPYALLGHQLSNWISAYLWAQDLSIRFIGAELPRDDTGMFNLSVIHDTLPADQKTMTKRLPPTYDERSESSHDLLKAALRRYSHKYAGRTLILRPAVDQARWDLTAAAPAVRAALGAGAYGDRLRRQEAAPPYIAIHIRRPAYANELAPHELSYRWVAEDWYLDLIDRLAEQNVGHWPIRVYALGTTEDFPRLSQKPGFELRLNGPRDEDFVDLCAARVLVVAPSSFSFNAALASRGVVLARVPWWHHIPTGGRWVPVDEAGQFDSLRYREALDGTPGGG